MATDAWQTTRDGVVALWRRVNPARADGVDASLTEARSDVVLAREQGDTAAEEALALQWQGRLLQFLAAHPDAAQELDRVLREARAQLPASEQMVIGTIRLEARASGHGRVYQAGRDQHITER
ncbi:hypothetical protein ACGFYU_08955 [Streptomyces sp. NPDC048337]|uniref:hypothetical protein n=1 Tax=Streptomyces sp. NPDC048337 TaxID=3365535 RepID=UPI0037118BAD